MERSAVLVAKYVRKVSRRRKMPITLYLCKQVLFQLRTAKFGEDSTLVDAAFSTNERAVYLAATMND